jgi:hypothetical protein
MKSTESQERDAVPLAAAAAETGAASNPPTQAPAQIYDSQFAILQALQKGEITVAEAEALLRSL